VRVRVRWRRRGPLLERSDRRAIVQPDDDVVPGAEQLHPHVVAQRVVAGDRQDAERSARQAKRDDGRVDVVVLGEHGEGDDAPVGVDLHDLLAGHEPERVEVVDAEVAEDAAGDRDVLLVGRLGIVAGHPDHVQGPEPAAPDEVSRRDVAGVEAPLEPDLQLDPPLGDVGHDLGGRVEIERDRLLTERREPGVRRGADQRRVLGRGRGDDDAVHRTQEILDAPGELGADLPGDRLRPRPVDVGDDDGLDLRMRGERADMDRSDPTHADDADPHPLPPPLRLARAHPPRAIGTFQDRRVP
jgi:hypothetical protein